MELLYTDQGAFVFRLYSIGHHHFDTSQLWLQIFQYLIQQECVPAIILPENNPSQKIFALLKNLVPTEYFGSLISFQ